MKRVCVPVGEDLGAYGFPHGHPFGPKRLAAFWELMQTHGLDQKVIQRAPVQADRAAIERFHTAGYVDLVQRLSESGTGVLDHGDTPAFAGCYEAAATVVGSALDVLSEVMAGRSDRGFVPIGGLHHARRGLAGGFCIFNDCAVVIQTLRAEHGIGRVAYVDIDAHHGDGVYYDFAADPDLIIADIHEDGRFLYPGSGAASERGVGEAEGTKLNLPLPPDAGDGVFEQEWARAEAFIEDARPGFILLQCGADCVAGDPLTHLKLSPQSHALAARALVRIANEHCSGRLIAFGGGGYRLSNLAAAWTAVVRELLEE